MTTMTILVKSQERKTVTGLPGTNRGPSGNLFGVVGLFVYRPILRDYVNRVG